MGLEGPHVEIMEKMASFTEPLQMLPTLALSLSAEMSKLALEGNVNGSASQTSCGLLDLGLNGTNLLLDENATGQSLLMQAQALIRKSHVYQQIDEALRKLTVFHPNVYHNVPQASATDATASSSSSHNNNNHHHNHGYRGYYYYNNHNHHNDRDDEDDDSGKMVTSLHRDAAINNLRFLNIFYGYSPATFALAVNLLDRLLGKVKAHPKYLSCIATCCFLIAAKTLESNAFIIPSAAELVKLSQCGGSAADLLRMERLILDKLQWELQAVTPLAFLQLFYQVFAAKDPRLAAHPTLPATLTSNLEVLLCQFEFTRYRADLLALALLSYKLQELDLLNSVEHFTTVVELQYYCQMADEEFLQCRGLVMDYLTLYGRQPSKLPRLRLVWSVSRRTLSKAKPSTRVLLDLETIMEDEVDPSYPPGPETSDDGGVFDSENDESGGGGGEINLCGGSSGGSGVVTAKGKEPLSPPEPNNNSKMATCPLQNKQCADLSFTLHSDNN